MQELRRRGSSKVAWIIISVSAILIGLCVFIIFLLLKFFGMNNGLIVASIFYDVFTTIFVIATFIFGYFQWLAAEQLRQSRQAAIASSSQGPRGILAIPPPTNPIVVQQRESIVKNVYAKLNQPLAKAIVLTGVIGNGKSYIASLVRDYAENQRIANQGSFTNKPIWLEFDQNTIISDIAVTIFKELGKPMPILENLSVQNQAAALFNALNELDETRLIVLDQFDRLLDTQTGYLRTDIPGIGEWLDAILSQPCKCRFLLTSRLWPRGPHGYEPTNENEYYVEGLSDNEAKQLLQSLSNSASAQAQPNEFHEIFVYCNNHPLALVLLSSRLKFHNLDLSNFLNDPAHIKRWIEEIASNSLDGGLNTLYETQLTSEQQKLLLAFSIFRKPVLRDAAQAIFKLQIQPNLILFNCEVLIRLSLLRALGVNGDYYRLHPIVSAYAQYQFDRNSEETNQEMLQAAHTEAAKYYLQQARRPAVQKEVGPNSTLWRSYMVEAIWHQCQSRQHQKAYTLLERENIFPNLRNEQESMILLDLYQQLLPSNNWNPGPTERLHIYANLGEIYKALGRKQDALKYYGEVLVLSRVLRDYNREQRTLEIITELS